MDPVTRLRVVQGLTMFFKHAFALVARMVGTIAGASLFVFFLLEISIPGGFRAVVFPFGERPSPRQMATVEEFHLDENIFVRFYHWFVSALQGDFGRSLTSGDSVINVIAPRLSISLEIMLIGVLLTVLIGVPLGLAAVALEGRRSAGVLRVIMGLSQSIPVYVTPLFLISFFAVQQQWLPASGWVRISNSISGNLKNLILPMTALVFAEIGIVARIVRADVLRVMQSDFIAAAMGKGLSQRYILFRHALRPASLGLLNVIGLNIGSLLSGALVIELIFGIGAMGQILVESTLNRDLYLMLGVTTYAVVVYVLLGTIVDALTRFLDPRIRRSVT